MLIILGLNDNHIFDKKQPIFEETRFLKCENYMQIHHALAANVIKYSGFMQLTSDQKINNN